MFFKEDKLFNGFAGALVATAAGAFAILLVQRFLHIDALSNMKMYLFSVVPEIFVLRWYAKEEKLSALKGSVIALVLTLGAIIIALMKYHYIEI